MERHRHLGRTLSLMLLLLGLCPVWTSAFVYDREVAFIAVEFASAVYTEDETQLLNWTCCRCDGETAGFQVKEVVFDVVYNLQAVVGFSPGHQSLVVAFRGTHEKSLSNWIADLQFQQLDLSYPGVDNAVVHKGFYYSYHNTSLRERILPAMGQLVDAYPGLPVLITGHSLGGALATLCALDLKVHFGLDGIRVVTFGQPRVGNRAFATHYNKLLPNNMRMTHDNDAVPHLPPFTDPDRILSYYHVATEIWLHSVGFFRKYMIETVCDSSGEDPNCSRSVKGNSILDHLMYLGVPLRTPKSRRLDANAGRARVRYMQA